MSNYPNAKLYKIESVVKSGDGDDDLRVEGIKVLDLRGF